MNLARAFRVYFVGWKNFIMSCFQVILWQLILWLPLFPLWLLAPGPGSGEGGWAWLARLLPVVVMLLWIPLVSYMLGELLFRIDLAGRKKKRTGIDEELELLSRATRDPTDT